MRITQPKYLLGHITYCEAYYLIFDSSILSDSSEMLKNILWILTYAPCVIPNSFRQLAQSVIGPKKTLSMVPEIPAQCFLLSTIFRGLTPLHHPIINACI